MNGQGNTFKERDSGLEGNSIKRFLVLFYLFILSLALYPQSFELKNLTSYKEGQSGVISGFIKDIAVTKDSVWFATARGAMRFTKGGSSFRTYDTGNSQLADNYVTGISADGDNIWFATANGLSVFNTRNNSWRSFRKEANGLSDSYLTCILVDGNYVWIGTRTWGLNRYDTETNEFAKFGEVDGLNSNSITSLAKSGRYIWVGSEGGLNRYDIYSGEWAGFGKEQGLALPKLTINAIIPEGNIVWIGTIAGLYRFDSNDEKFVKHSLSTVVFSIVPDGPYLWVGTFDGIYRVNKETQTYQLFTRRNGLIDNSINCIAIDSNYLWLGTETPGGGVMRVDKELPEVEISSRSTYTKINEISIIGTVQDTSGIKNYSLSYRSLLIGGPWKTEGIRLAAQSGNIVNGVLGTLVIDPKKFNEETYEFKLIAVSNRGKQNEITYNIIIDKTEPNITFTSIPQAVSKATYLLEGQFQEANMSSIWIKQGDVRRKARISLSGLGGIGTMGGGKFSQIIQLKPGKNVIEIIAEDIGKHVVSKKIEINYDTASPQISFSQSDVTTSERLYKIIGTVVEDNLEKIILQQGNITLYPGGFQGFTIQKVNNNTYNFIYQATLNPGVNEFTFIAQDYSDKRGRATIKVTYKTDAPRIEFEQNLATRSTEETYTVSGRWDDNDLTIIEITNATSNEKTKAVINKDKKTFSAQIKLKPGPNIISAAAIDQAGNVTTITMNDPVRYATSYTPEQVQTVAINPGDTEEIRKIKEELNKLRKENSDLKNRIAALERGAPAGAPAVVYQRTGRGPKVPIPQGNALYLVPYQLGGSDRLTDIAQDYLGSSRNYGEIAYFNNQTSSTIIRNRKSILVPTPGLLRMIYSDAKPSLIRKVVDILGETFNTMGPGQRITNYLQEIINRFRTSIGTVNTEGTIVYAAGISVAIQGLSSEMQLLEFMRNKNIKTGLYVIFSHNAVIFKKVNIQ